jgi:hypothetical protein
MKFYYYQHFSLQQLPPFQLQFLTIYWHYYEINKYVFIIPGLYSSENYVRPPTPPYLWYMPSTSSFPDPAISTSPILSDSDINSMEYDEFDLEPSYPENFLAPWEPASARVEDWLQQPWERQPWFPSPFLRHLPPYEPQPQFPWQVRDPDLIPAADSASSSLFSEHFPDHVSSAESSSQIPLYSASDNREVGQPASVDEDHLEIYPRVIRRPFNLPPLPSPRVMYEASPPITTTVYSRSFDPIPTSRPYVSQASIQYEFYPASYIPLSEFAARVFSCPILLYQPPRQWLNGLYGLWDGVRPPD